MNFLSLKVGTLWGKGHDDSLGYREILRGFDVAGELEVFTHERKGPQATHGVVFVERKLEVPGSEAARFAA